MKKRITLKNFVFQIPMFFLLIALCPCSMRGKAPVDINRKFTPEQLIEDVNFYVKTLEETHINPFANVSAEKFRRQAESIKTRIRQQGPMTQKEFWRLFTPLVASIGDSHSFVVETRFFIKAEDDPMKYLPVRADYIDGKIFVTESFADEKIEKGSIITSINGIAAKDLLRKVRDYQFGTTREKTHKAAEWLWIGAAEVLGQPEEFKIILGGRKKVAVKGMKLPEIMKREKAAKNSLATVSATASNDNSPLELNFLDDGVAYLNARTFDYDLEKYKTILADAFTRIKSAGADKLIIDLRENGGGNSRLGNALIDMFNTKPYRTFANKWKRSVLFAETVKSDRLLYTGAEKYIAARPGEILISGPEIINPSANPFRFSGLVYILSGERTFSSGLMFLGLVKYNGLAKIFGEETNEPACHFGEVMRFKLPHSGLRTAVSVKSWVLPSGCKGTGGVVPDMIVKRSVGDYLSGRDTILDTALKLIKKEH